MKKIVIITLLHSACYTHNHGDKELLDFVFRISNIAYGPGNPQNTYTHFSGLKNIHTSHNKTSVWLQVPISLKIQL